MEPDLAAMVMDSLGLSIADLKAAGADACDLAALTGDRDDAPSMLRLYGFAWPVPPGRRHKAH